MKMRPQLKRNQADFIHGTSGQTIEIDDEATLKNTNDLTRNRGAQESAGAADFYNRLGKRGPPKTEQNTLEQI